MGASSSGNSGNETGPILGMAFFVYCGGKFTTYLAGMQYKSIKGFNGASQFGILLVFTGLGMVLTGLVQLAIGSMMVPQGTPFSKMNEAIINAMKNPANVNLTRWMQVLGTCCMMFIPAFLFSLICNGKKMFWLGFNKNLSLYQVLLGFLIIFTSNILAGPFEDLVKSITAHFPSFDQLAHNMEARYNEQVTIISNLKNWPEFLLAIFIMAFFPALFEEMFFRGALQNLLVRWWKMPILAIFVTALLFSLIHASVYLFLSRLLLGFVLGYLFYQTKNLWVNTIAHFLNNLLALAQLFAMSRKHQPVDPSAIDPKVEWWLALIALFSLIFLFKLLHRYSVHNRMKIYTKEQRLYADAQIFSSIS
jgi:hypothetical protein